MPSALTMSMAYLEHWNWLMSTSSTPRDRQDAHRRHKLTLHLAQSDAEATAPHRQRDCGLDGAPSVVPLSLPGDGAQGT